MKYRNAQDNLSQNYTETKIKIIIKSSQQNSSQIEKHVKEGISNSPGCTAEIPVKNSKRTLFFDVHFHRKYKCFKTVST